LIFKNKRMGKLENEIKELEIKNERLDNKHDELESRIFSIENPNGKMAYRSVQLIMNYGYFEKNVIYETKYGYFNIPDSISITVVSWAVKDNLLAIKYKNGGEIITKTYTLIYGSENKAVENNFDVNVEGLDFIKMEGE